MIKAIRTAFMTVALSFVSAMSFYASAQNTNVRVSGNVVDESGTPLSGVVVYVKSGNTKDATVTDGNGAYSIGASSASSLVYSCLGYKEQEILVGNQSVINVKLVLDSFNLDDAVVIGYGSQKMKDLTGGLSVVNREALEMVSTGNLMDRISGQVAGLTVTTSSEAPGSNQSLLIRGQNSLSATNSPLIVLDGIPYEGGLADIDPDIVESMTVLKDASSVAIYGSRGSNGVILIQTKKGKEGTMSVTYKTRLSIAQPRSWARRNSSDSSRTWAVSEPNNLPVKTSILSQDRSSARQRSRITLSASPMTGRTMCSAMPSTWTIS